MARPARLARLPLAFGPPDGGAQDAQDILGPGFARPVEFGLQPMLGGLAGGEQLLLRADPRLGRGRVGRRRGRRGQRRVFGASATSVAASSPMPPVPLRATASGPAFGMMYAPPARRRLHPSLVRRALR